ncbi:carbohydrate binding domain-containing protein [Pelagicoccus sp. NFK12]|uniref:Carbohydrate binding domain-containing protein n=1 Tax=Pelagicoccus enzymogenes TaxID=2773457 RepID=A0A927F6B0_9BACT|nr:carbohydrate binding domain-containing protein [Pelagicoccus enzymogenes]MBD5778795.1 carbohydrate binding domain-containing protein [Pelagicoccus enzymogenes]
MTLVRTAREYESSQGWAVSEDGKTVAGRLRSENGAQAFRWTKEEGFRVLGRIDTTRPYDLALDISADGSVVVGYAESSKGTQAFRWSESEGLIGLGFLGGFPHSEARIVSEDGETIWGFSDTARGEEIFKWTYDSGMEGLGIFGEPEDANSEGTVLVGRFNRDSNDRYNGHDAFRWEKGKGSIRLAGPNENERSNSLAKAVSENGQMVVGYAQEYRHGPKLGVFWHEAVNWRATTLNEYFDSNGFNRNGLSFTTITDASADGLTLFGYCQYNGRGSNYPFRVQLDLGTPPPPTDLFSEVLEAPIFGYTIYSYPEFNLATRLSWGASEGADVSEYLIYRDGVLIGSTSKSEFVDSFVLPGEGYSYHLVAVNTKGFASERSEKINLRIPKVVNSIRDGEFQNDPTRSGPWSVVKTGDVDIVHSSKLPEEVTEDPLSDTNYLTIKSETSDDEWTLGQLIRDVNEFGEYQLSFSARSKEGSDLVVALKGEGYGDVEDPFFLTPTTFNLTPKWQVFTVNFNIDDRFKRLDHLLIAIGNNEDLKENESIDIDHIVLWNRLGAETPMPQKPTELNARFVSRSAVLLEWDLPIGTAGVVEYEIIRDGKIVGSSNNRSYIDQKLATPGPYLYEIVAIDSQGNRSAPSPARKVFNGPNVQASDIVPYLTLGNMSPDGKAFLWAVRSELTGNMQIKKWTEAGEVVVSEQEEPYSLAIWSVANEGRAAAGMASHPELDYSVPFHWSECDGLKYIDLGPLEGIRGSFAVESISATGNAIVGSFWERFAPEAFRWTEAEGLQLLGKLPGDYTSSYGIAVSGDGSVVVGHHEGYPFNYAGFVWTERGGREEFGPFHVEGSEGLIADVSSDGKTLIGEARVRPNKPFQYRWSEADGVIELSGLDRQKPYYSYAVSGDGSMVVGTAKDAEDTSNAIFWYRRYNWSPININEFMLSVGHDTKGEFYSTISNVSDDGRTLLLGAGGSNTRIRLNLSTRDSENNLVHNSGFEESWRFWGLSRWDRSLSKEKKLIETPGFMEERAARIRMGNLAGDPKTLHLRQNGIELEPNTDYYLSFSVKASMPGKAMVRLFKDDNPSNNYGVDEEFELTTEWQTHVIEFRTDALGEYVSNGRLQFTFLRGGFKRVLEFFVDEVAIHEK